MSTRSYIGHHLVFMGYGHWLSNDPRGSGSTDVRAPELDVLGPIHFGRKKIQPTREELRAFFEDAQTRLEHERIWFDAEMRRVIAEALGKVVKDIGYTAWAGAVLQNHAHGVLRIHREKGEVMWERMALASREALRDKGLVPKAHPVWSNRPYVVYKTSVGAVRRAIAYVDDNFARHRLRKEIYPWITPYDGFTFDRKKRP